MPQDVNATLHMSASASRIGKITDGRNLTSVPRILDNRTMGEMLWTEFLYHDPVKNLDYFEAFSPHGLSTFGLIQTSRRGNPPQLLVLTITEYVRASGENVADSSEPPKKPAVAAAPPAPSPSPMPQITEDPGRSAKVYTNANGTVTQATLLRSTDGLATISIGEGIVAKDAQGKPLTVITLKALPSDSLPAGPSGSAFSFSGMAQPLSARMVRHLRRTARSRSLPPGCGGVRIIRSDHLTGDPERGRTCPPLSIQPPVRLRHRFLISAPLPSSPGLPRQPRRRKAFPKQRFLKPHNSRQRLRQVPSESLRI